MNKVSPKLPIGRVVICRPDRTGPEAAACFLAETLDKHWPDGKRVKFLITPGGFLCVQKHGSFAGRKGWNSTENDIRDFIATADAEIRKTAMRTVLTHARGKADFITLGIDVTFEDGVGAELVSVVDVTEGLAVHWTGKSYPTDQDRKLVHVVDLKTHFLSLDGERVMILGCYDLTMWSPRGCANRTIGGNRRIRCDAMRQHACEWKPTAVLHHPHTTVKPKTWSQSWSSLHQKLPTVRAWASGIYYDQPTNSHPSLNDVLRGTRSGTDSVLDIIPGSRTPGP